MTRRIGLRLDPLDGLFFRDGRPFDAASRVEGGLPNPQTLSGALRTALLTQHWGADFGRRLIGVHGPTMRARLEKAGAPTWILDARFRGPWLARTPRGGALQVLVPVPTNLVREKESGRLARSWPLEKAGLPGWKHPENHLPLWRRGGAEAKPVAGYLTTEGLRAYLQGEVPASDQIVAGESLFDYDHRTGIEIRPDALTSDDGAIYGLKLLVLQREVSFYAELLPGDGAPDGTLLEGPIPFGGEGKYARVSETSLCPWPEVVASGKRALWLMLTPGVFAATRPHLPDHLPGTLRAAASGSPLAVSGWNVHANGPNATRFVVPPGAVYFTEGSADQFEAQLCADEERTAQGWGFALRGVWNDAQ